VATIRFLNLPAQLVKRQRDSDSDSQFAIDILGFSKNVPIKSLHPISIDQHFGGTTVLFSPPAGKHHIDVLAVHGLGGHAFGSFIYKEDGHMWLVDSLPHDMPTARVMIYGYPSKLQDSISFANFSDLAGDLQIAVSRLLRSENKKQLVLIGHSFGGLLI